MIENRNVSYETIKISSNRENKFKNRILTAILQ